VKDFISIKRERMVDNLSKYFNEQNLKTVKVELQNDIVIITIDNPPVNALTKEVMMELSESLDNLKEMSHLRVAILTGEGDRFFVAGADIKQFPHLDGESGEELVREGNAIFNKIQRLTFPVLCAVNGMALGGGCELILACDIRIASENAVFGFPEVGLGIIPGYGGTQRLPRLVGGGKAKELIFSGDPISAEEAYRIGLVQRLVPPGKALEETMKLAESIAKRAPLAVAKAKEVINQGMDVTLQEGINLESRASRQLFDTDDKNEGAKAFIDKRKPVFKGK
jgi:enoyl-CoA hydratase